LRRILGALPQMRGELLPSAMHWGFWSCLLLLAALAPAQARSPMPRGRRSFSYAAWRHVLQVLQPAAAGRAGGP
jgi:hypothetical protein